MQAGRRGACSRVGGRRDAVHALGRISHRHCHDTPWLAAQRKVSRGHGGGVVGRDVHTVRGRVRRGGADGAGGAVRPAGRAHGQRRPGAEASEGVQRALMQLAHLCWSRSTLRGLSEDTGSTKTALRVCSLHKSTCQRCRLPRATRRAGDHDCYAGEDQAELQGQQNGLCCRRCTAARA